MEKSFRLGITMAGAVSAGAYTGGVLDYLFQTLDAWYRDKDRSDVPKHSVSLDIISGASAGGITGAMAALALHLENRNPVTPDKREDEAYLRSNVFYNAWVNLTREDMIPELLGTRDIEENGKAVSLLNSEFIVRLAKSIIVCVPKCTVAPPPYVSRGMELILTLSNLDGFTYDLNFSGEGSSKHRMKQHRDYAFFRLGNDYGGDGRIPLNLQREDVGLQELLESAPATGAFPIGLAYRKFVRKKKYILNNKDLVFYRKGISLLADIADGDPEEDYVTYNVDGGMLNNEPFDLTMKLMARSAPDSATALSGELKKEEQEFNSSIIMIDPFPSDDSIEAGTTADDGAAAAASPSKGFADFPYSLLEAAARVFASMRGELLFKGEDIVRAFSEEDFSRFMIAPRRREKTAGGNENVYNGSVAIACGALGGFSGFFDKSFRRHDFFLGRKNCQSFLRKYFRVKLENGVPVNPLFAEGYTPEAVERFRFQDEQEKEALRKAGRDAAEAPWYVPIIPDVYKEDPQYKEVALAYPQYDMTALDRHKAAILKRFKMVAGTFGSSWVYQVAVMLGFRVAGNKIYGALRRKIEDAFRGWRLL